MDKIKKLKKTFMNIMIYDDDENNVISYYY